MYWTALNRCTLRAYTGTTRKIKTSRRVINYYRKNLGYRQRINTKGNTCGFIFDDISILDTSYLFTPIHENNRFCVMVAYHSTHNNINIMHNTIKLLNQRFAKETVLPQLLLKKHPEVIFKKKNNIHEASRAPILEQDAFLNHSCRMVIETVKIV